MRIALDAKDARIVPDMGATVSFLEQARPAGDADAPRHVRVPAAAIVERDGADVAFVVEDERAVRRAVRTGERIGGNVEILEGLAAGDELVLDPDDALEDGARVQPGDAE